MGHGKRDEMGKNYLINTKVYLCVYILMSSRILSTFINPNNKG